MFTLYMFGCFSIYQVRFHHRPATRASGDSVTESVREWSQLLLGPETNHTATDTTIIMPWGAPAKEKKEEKEPDISEEDVLRYNINEVTNDTLESTR